MPTNPETRSSHGRPRRETGGAYGRGMTGTAPTTFRDRHLDVLAVLVAGAGRVVGRGELIRRAGLRELAPRRVDALLVEVRRIVGDTNLVNVRGRGWMLLEVPEPVRVLLADAADAA